MTSEAYRFGLLEPEIKTPLSSAASENGEDTGYDDEPTDPDLDGGEDNVIVNPNDEYTDLLADV